MIEKQGYRIEFPDTTTYGTVLQNYAHRRPQNVVDTNVFVTHSTSEEQSIRGILAVGGGRYLWETALADRRRGLIRVERVKLSVDDISTDAKKHELSYRITDTLHCRHAHEVDYPTLRAGVTEWLNRQRDDTIAAMFERYRVKKRNVSADMAEVQELEAALF